MNIKKVKKKIGLKHGIQAKFVMVHSDIYNDAVREIKRLERENEELKNLLKESEDDLYHICLFNPWVKSASYSKISKYLNASSIGETGEL